MASRDWIKKIINLQNPTINVEPILREMHLHRETNPLIMKSIKTQKSICKFKQINCETHSIRETHISLVSQNHNKSSKCNAKTFQNKSKCNAKTTNY